MFVTIVVVFLHACQDDGAKEKKSSYDVAAFYWPDYHYEPRLEFIFSDKKGEWQTVYEAEQRDSFQQQPRVPLWGYQDEADPIAMNQKIEAAVSHGVNTFIFDWYWYDDQPLLESALDSGFLVANEDWMQFYIMWANHDATAYWDPEEPDKSKVYWSGQVDSSIFSSIQERLIDKYFKQDSYYQIDGSPVFSIYELNNLIEGLGGVKKTKAALDEFRTKVKDAGFKNLHLQAILWSAFPDKLEEDEISIESQDEIMKYFRFNSFTNYTWAHIGNPDGEYTDWADTSMAVWSDYTEDFSIPYFPQVSIGWDPNPRFPFKIGFVRNTTPEKFRDYLQKAKEYVDSSGYSPRLVTINSWNEWTEGSYLEPDTLYKMKYLEAVKSVFATKNRE